MLTGICDCKLSLLPYLLPAGSRQPSLCLRLFRQLERFVGEQSRQQRELLVLYREQYQQRLQSELQQRQRKSGYE